MILRFCCGSVTPLQLARGTARVASMTCRSILKWSRKVVSTSSRSFLRSRPLSTKMQTSWSPIALCSSAATTEESTPPERPQMTLPLPTCSRTRRDGLLDEVAHRPGAGALADLVEEVLEDLLAARRVGDFGVELHAVERPGLVPRGGVGAGGRGRQRDEIGGQVVDLVAVAHPDGGVLRAGRGRADRSAGDVQLRPAELARLGRLHLAAEDLRAELHAVADAEDGHAQVEDLRVALGRARLVNAARPAGEDDALGVELLELVERRCRAGRARCRRPASRTRRAMSWAYCEPKSRIGMTSSCCIRIY